MTDGEQTADALPDLTDTFRSLHLGVRVTATLDTGAEFTGTVRTLNAHEHNDSIDARVTLNTDDAPERFQSVELRYTATDGDVLTAQMDGVGWNENDDRVKRPLSDLETLEIHD